jgi:hypothetical protein
MIETPIDDNSFLILAMHHYDNTQCVNLAEFEEDLKRFGYLKKLFNRYRDNGDLKERLIINHLIVLYNLFGIIATDFLFYKIEKEYWNLLATFLVYLNRMPESIPERNIHLSELELDNTVIEKLRKI